MTVYITIQDVDELLGDTWTAADKKGKAVLQANTWMTALNLQDIDPEHSILICSWRWICSNRG